MTNEDAAIRLVHMYESIYAVCSYNDPNRQALVKAIWALQNAPEEKGNNNDT